MSTVDAGTVVLSVEDLVVRYGSRTVVDGLSFTVQRGEILGLLGPNGAGKTSTLSVIEGLRVPAAGRVTLDGIDIIRDPLTAKARIGVQLQTSSFQPELSLEQLIRLYAGLYGQRPPRADIDRRLRDSGLGPERGKRFKSLSGGQQQRFSLLIAVLHRPPILLLDEPTNGLDPQSRRTLWDRIERSRTTGHSVLLTTHSMEEAQAVCDRVAIIDHGTLLTSGTPSELITAHRDDPPVRRLARGEVTLEDVFLGLTGKETRD